MTKSRATPIPQKGRGHLGFHNNETVQVMKNATQHGAPIPHFGSGPLGYHNNETVQVMKNATQPVGEHENEDLLNEVLLHLAGTVSENY